MTVRNSERYDSWSSEERAVNNVIYIDAHRKRRNRRAEKREEMNNGLILFAIIAFTLFTLCLFNL